MADQAFPSTLFPEAELAVEACLRQWPGDLDEVAPGWRPLLDRFLASPAGVDLGQFLQARLQANAVIYPSQPFRALALTAPEDVKVVILGQDPYHGPGQANGLAFDVAAGVKLPPSLRNIHKELASEFGRSPQVSGLLERWAQQGVLLLNTSLTVEDAQPASHARVGWQQLTDAIFDQLVQARKPMVFMLWGAHAQAKAQGRQGQGRQHLWLMANHPSPLSALRPPVPFMGCNHFRRANEFLAENGLSPIDWMN